MRECATACVRGGEPAEVLVRRAALLLWGPSRENVLYALVFCSPFCTCLLSPQPSPSIESPYVRNGGSVWCACWSFNRRGVLLLVALVSLAATFDSYGNHLGRSWRCYVVSFRSGSTFAPTFFAVASSVEALV